MKIAGELVYVKTENEIVPVKISDITDIQISGYYNYHKIYLMDNTSVVETDENRKSMIKKIKQIGFLEVHPEDKSNSGGIRIFVNTDFIDWKSCSPVPIFSFEDEYNRIWELHLRNEETQNTLKLGWQSVLLLLETVCMLRPSKEAEEFKRACDALAGAPSR